VPASLPIPKSSAQLDRVVQRQTPTSPVQAANLVIAVLRSDIVVGILHTVVRDVRVHLELVMGQVLPLPRLKTHCHRQQPLRLPLQQVPHR
jgi:hypothetical protein